MQISVDSAADGNLENLNLLLKKLYTLGSWPSSGDNVGWFLVEKRFNVDWLVTKTTWH